MKLSLEDLTKLESLHNEYLRINELLTYEEVVLDRKLCYKYEKDRDLLAPIMTKYEKYVQLSELIEEFTNESTMEKEVEELTQQLDQVVNEVKILLLTHNSTAQEIVIEVVDLKDSSNLQKDIVNGYINFSQNNGFKTNKKQDKNTTLLIVSGNNVKDIFTNEVGTHVANDETCNVFIYDKYIEEEISFNDSDIEITIARSSGAGGQHINTTDSAIKITHLKTGITATCQSERNQIQNREKALQVLKERVTSHYSKLKIDYIANAKKEQLKLMKSNIITKQYNYELGVVVKNKKDTISLKQFLLGKEL